MKQIKNLWFVLVFVSVVLIFVVIRITNTNVFQQEANVAVETAGNNLNLISTDELKNNPAIYMLVNLNPEIDSNTPGENVIHIPFEKLLDKTNRTKLEDSDLKIVLFSTDVSTSAKAWVILNQLKFKNLYILQTDKNEEVLKYKFQPDTTARLE